MVLLDTNYIIRYLIKDIPEQYSEADVILFSENLVLLPEVLLESIHVLDKVYKIGKHSIANMLVTILDCDNVFIDNKQCYIRTLQAFKTSPLSYTDLYLIETALETGRDIKSFDKQLLKHFKIRKSL